MNAEKVLLSVHRHSDLVWRRTKAGYEEVREKQILQMLSLFEKYPEYRFCFAQTEILKAFIESHPEFEDTIAKLIKAKRIELQPRWLRRRWFDVTSIDLLKKVRLIAETDLESHFCSRLG